MGKQHFALVGELIQTKHRYTYILVVMLINIKIV